MKKSVVLTIGLVLVASLAACGGILASDNGLEPTQTPQFVVVTQEPTPTPATLDLFDSSVVEYPPFYSCKPGVIEQPFENGRMFWMGIGINERCLPKHTYMPGTGEIFVLIFAEDGRGGEWLNFVDNWDSSLYPVSEPEFEPEAENLLQPVNGFGYVWRSLLSEDQRARMGWATYVEVPYLTTYTYESGGFMNEDWVFVPQPGAHIVIDALGNQFTLSEASMTFEFLPVEELQQ